MNTQIKPLWLHAYTGRENGLMVVGTAESLRALAMQIGSVTAVPQASASWPPLVATPETIGPYTNVSNFKLSFHLESAAPLEKVVPHGPSRMKGLLNTLIAVLAGVGAVSIVRWAVTGAL